MLQKILSMIVVIILTAGFSPASAKRVVVDRIVAVVGETVITESELDRLTAPLMAQMSQRTDKKDLSGRILELRNDVLERMIDQELMLLKADELGIRITRADVDQTLERFMSSNDISSEKELDQALKMENLTLEEFRENLERRQKINRLERQEIHSRVLVTDVEINEYYNDNIDRYRRSAQAKLRIILLEKQKSVFAESEKELMTKAQKIKEEIENQDDFAAAARIYSDAPNAKNGGLMGWVNIDDQLPELQEQIERLDEGEISPPFLTDYGVNLIMVIEKKEAYYTPLEEIRDEIWNELFTKEYEQQYQDYLDELRDEYFVDKRLYRE